MWDESLPGRVRELEAENRALREELERVRTSSPEVRPVDRISAMIGYWDRDLKNQFANQAYSRWFDVDPQQLKGRSFQELMGPERFAALLPHIEGALRGERQRFERFVRSSDGRLTMHAAVEYVPDVRDGAVVGFATHITDVTELKLAEAALRASEAKLRALFELSPLGLALVDSRGRFVEFNQAFRDILGYSEAELRQLDRWVITPRTYEAEEARQLESILKTGRYGPYEKQYIRKDGSRVSVELNGVTVTGSDGAQYTWSIIENISARKRHEEALRTAMEDAEAASRAKSVFLANISHEVRTPLNGILGMAQVLMMSDPLTPEQRESSRTILEGGRALLTVLNDVLDLSALESGKLELINASFSVEELVNEVVLCFQPEAQRRGLTLLGVWNGEAGARFRGDPGRLRQMLGKLVTNALEFTRRGFVLLTARPLDPEGLQTVLELTVEDSGVGMSVEQQRALFTPFTQIDGSRTRVHGGAGVGLAMVRRLAELMGGDAHVDSEEDTGSRFTIRVRVSSTTSSSGSGQRKPSLVKLETARVVLLVDDNPVNQKVGQALLRKAGYACHSVHNGQLAVEAVLSELEPAVVLMDLHMPVMDGLQACEAIRTWERRTGRPAIPIVALTASAVELERGRCLAVGMNDVLSKPLQMDQLKAVLDSLLSPRPTRRAG